MCTPAEIILLLEVLIDEWHGLIWIYQVPLTRRSSKLTEELDTNEYVGICERNDLTSLLESHSHYEHFCVFLDIFVGIMKGV
jgi:hypothetical protein